MRTYSSSWQGLCVRRQFEWPRDYTGFQQGLEISEVKTDIRPAKYATHTSGDFYLMWVSHKGLKIQDLFINTPFQDWCGQWGYPFSPLPRCSLSHQLIGFLFFFFAFHECVPATQAWWNSALDGCSAACGLLWYKLLVHMWRDFMTTSSCSQKQSYQYNDL